MPSTTPWTLILPYYENAGMLKMQIDHISTWPEDLLKHFELIVVDDGSPHRSALSAVQAACEDKGLPFRFRLYRIGVDVRWNWLACRNLGAAEAATDWLLLTDIDHLVPIETVMRISRAKLHRTNIYRFSRRDYPDIPNPKNHPNSWLMTKEMFDRVGGYDERFSGYYGTDGMFRDRCIREAGALVVLPEQLIRVPREVLPDASTTSYGRKEPQDRAGVQRIRAEIEASGDPIPKRGLFPWTRQL